MKPPEGLECSPGKVLRLNTSFYNLKQSRHEWYIEASNGLLSLSLRPMASDSRLFTNRDRSLILGLYVDDMLIIGKNIDLIEKTISLIKKLWDIKDVENVEEILGLCVRRDRLRRRIELLQGSVVDVSRRLRGCVTGQSPHIPQGCALRSTYLLASQLGPDSSESGKG